MMAELLHYLENSTLVANIISFVVLGFAGVLVRSIIKGIGALAENKAELEKHANLAGQLRAIAEITFQSTLLYKNAIINSNLSPEAKEQALETFKAVKEAYETLLPKLQEKEEAPKPAAVEEVIEEFKQVGQDAISKLREQLK
jgi:hypothetical protein